MPAKAKKPATPGKKEEKGEAKKPLQEKKDNAPAKAKKEGAPKQASAPKKKDAAKPGGENKGKDQGKKRKLNETGQGKPKQGADSKKKKVEKKVQGKSGSQKRVGKKPVKKQLSSKVRSLKKTYRPKRLARRGKSEVVVYEGRRYFLLPSGHLKAMLDIKLEENDKVTKIDGVFIRKSDVKTFEEFKESVKGNPPTVVRRQFLLFLVSLAVWIMFLLKSLQITFFTPLI